MIVAHDVETVRRAELATAASLPAGLEDLMARAARAVAGVVIARLRAAGGVYGRHVVVLAGAGSNGGDALFAAAHLARRGVAVTAVLAARRRHPAGHLAARDAGVRVIDTRGEVSAAAAATQVLTGADVVLDGLLGTGSRPGLDPVASALVARIPRSAVVVAVDLPSGLAADTGELSGAHVVADATVAIGTAKPCLLLPPAAAAAGEVVVADIGLLGTLGPGVVERLDASAARQAWPVPGAEADKYSRGVVGVVAGSTDYTGAAVLAVAGAVHAGAGMVRYVGPDHPTELVRAAFPEVVPGGGRVQAWAAGSGTSGGDSQLTERLRPVLEQAADGTPTLLDAGALVGGGSLSGWVAAHGPFDPSATRVLLTPHAGELAALLSHLDEPTTRADVTQAPWTSARRAAALTGTCVLLKGATTVVVPAPATGAATSGSDTTRAQTDGPPWLASAGAGDVLAGIAGALLAAGLSPLEAGSLAAAIHGRAASHASSGGPLRALAVAQAVPAVVAHLLRTGQWPGTAS